MDYESFLLLTFRLFSCFCNLHNTNCNLEIATCIVGTTSRPIILHFCTQLIWESRSRYLQPYIHSNSKISSSILNAVSRQSEPFGRAGHNLNILHHSNIQYQLLIQRYWMEVIGLFWSRILILTIIYSNSKISSTILSAVSRTRSITVWFIRSLSKLIIICTCFTTETFVFSF